MRKELDDKLVKEFPKLFKDRHGDMRETAMVWGFDCGDGWYFLIRNLCQSIQGRIDSNPHLKLHQPTVFQVKEKFGSLRFYTDASDQETYGMIWFAEHLSSHICEECGKEGRIIKEGGWYSCRCYGCWKKEKNGEKGEDHVR
jgi:hypothetical protein